MNAEHTPQSPAAKTGLFAPLRAASSVAKGSGAPSLRLLGLLALAIAALLGLAVSSASAATTRQLQTQITEADGAPFANPFGLAVDNPVPA